MISKVHDNAFESILTKNDWQYKCKKISDKKEDIIMIAIFFLSINLH